MISVFSVNNDSGTSPAPSLSGALREESGLVCYDNQENAMQKWTWYLNISLRRAQSLILESQSDFGVIRLIDTNLSF